MARTRIFAPIAAACVLAAPAIAGNQFQVTIRGVVDFNQFTVTPLATVLPGEPATITFLLDEDDFVDDPFFPTRGYVIDEDSWSMTFDTVTAGLQDPFPAGTTPYFVVRDNDPAVDGFFLNTNTSGFPTGVPTEYTGQLGQINANVSVTYDGGTLQSLNIADAVGTYDFTGLQVFGFTMDDGFFQGAMGLDYTDLTIEEFAAPCGLTTVTEGFTGGTNAEGWTFGAPNEVIVSNGGNPGDFLRSFPFQTFAPICTTTDTLATSFVGDLRAKGATRISFDAFVGAGGPPAGFAMSLLLRDTKGTASDPNDDDYAYFVGPGIPAIGAGWTHYDFDIPSQSTDAVPSGWTGGWVGDPVNFRPGIDWNDVIESVDRVEIWFIDPSFFAIIQNWDVGVDNLEIETQFLAQQTQRQGLPNPQSYTSTPPVLGTTVVCTVDLSTTGHTTAFLVGYQSALDVALGNGARLLVNVADPNGELLALPSQGGPLATFGVAIPCDVSLAGLEVYTQALHLFGVTPFALSNSVDWTLGD